MCTRIYRTATSLQCRFHGRYNIIVYPTVSAVELYLRAAVQLHPDQRRYDFMRHFSLFDRSCGGPSCTYARTDTYTHTSVSSRERTETPKKPFRQFGLIYGFLGHALSRIILLCTIYYIREFIVLPRCVYIYTFARICPNSL